MIGAEMAKLKRTDNLKRRDKKPEAQNCASVDDAAALLSVSLADAIDDALGSGEMSTDRAKDYLVPNLGTSIPHSEVDRWRKLRAIPEGERRSPLALNPRGAVGLPSLNQSQFI